MEKPTDKIGDLITVYGVLETKIEAFEWDEEVNDFRYYFFDENGELDHTYKELVIIINHINK